jgi:hypothetical protein
LLQPTVTPENKNQHPLSYRKQLVRASGRFREVGMHGSLLALTFLAGELSDPLCRTHKATINLHSFCKRSKLPFTTTSHLPLRNDSGTFTMLVKRFMT